METSSLIAPHQEEFARTAHKWTGIFHSVGCGKTRTTLYTARDCDGSILIIAPKTTMQKQQWQKEARLLGMKEPTVISKETFRRDSHILPRYRALILEEAHFFAGVTCSTRQRKKQIIPRASQLYEATLAYIETHQPERLFCVTGTPNKSPMAIYALATLLGRKWDYYAFREAFYVRLPMPQREVYAPKRTQDRIDKLAELTRSLGPVLRLEDIKDVPEQTHLVETFPLTTAQTDALRTLPARFTDQGALRLKRHQVENGILYEDLFDPVTKRVSRQVERFPNEKIDYIIDRAYEFKKMLIFANYTEQVDAIAEALTAEGFTNVLVMTGQTNNRKELIDKAESSDSAYMVVQASISSEWEWKTCAVVVFASLSNRAVDYLQSLGRVQRYDAIKKNLYITLVTDYPRSVDKRWHELILSGKDANDALFDVDDTNTEGQ